MNLQGSEWPLNVFWICDLLLLTAMMSKHTVLETLHFKASRVWMHLTHLTCLVARTTRPHYILILPHFPPPLDLVWMSLVTIRGHKHDNICTCLCITYLHARTRTHKVERQLIQNASYAELSFSCWPMFHIKHRPQIWKLSNNQNKV